MTINNQEFYRLFKNSKLAQVANPLRKTMRDQSALPTHQIIYTPKSSAIRSNFGMKSYLPKQIGSSHIIFNDIDNKKNMPDVEKYSGSMYNRLKFQETGAVVKNFFSESNLLFPSGSTKSVQAKSDTEDLPALFYLSSHASVKDCKKMMQRNPKLFKGFQQWLLKNKPHDLISSSNQSVLLKNLREYLKTAPNDVIVKYKPSVADFTKKHGKLSNNAPSVQIQGNAGFSYALKGRFNNTPNGIKYGSVAPGRIVSDRGVAVGGFVARLNERTATLQHNYAKNYPGKHTRQFVMPFKITEAELTPEGRISLNADGVKVGSWLQETESDEPSIDRSNYQPQYPNFGSAAQRNGKNNTALQNLMNLISH
ncbi:37S ribosomal protein Mrp51p, mitochondrial [[Candida] railenensis]|uniref:37S ribosomal protein Mrp51p, mitochondrial n=1 Tax=[Candida] railenensis TaxID=45579 RepID=A0A9P0QTY1_9ASCO|nr:37S ribosomal protein Mrp51p, mitochondrial [[Candida] railenensis]